MLCHSNDERDLRFYGLLNGFSTLSRCYKHSGSVRLELLFGFLYTWQKRQTKMLAFLSWSNSSDNVGSIFETVLRVAGCYTASKTLIYYTSMLANA